MEDPTTIALHLTFFGTLGVAFVMFLGLLAVFVATLVIAGVGHLAAFTVMAVAGGVARAARTVAAAVRPAAFRSAPGGPARKEAPQLSADWTDAVARADARAAARAKAEAVPAPKAVVRDLPGSAAPEQPRDRKAG